ncbi:hypothetical protein ESCO_002759 [Escovopsis weberi]|uniref:Uncharacterized protein n=1 Tax=Escovopsis weberi TaxID=150374 RepID=A0A0M9VSH7_ESCWE|nr:hypothetical protein ESCO_002759 [Escovopsis weberi]
MDIKHIVEDAEAPEAKRPKTEKQTKITPHLEGDANEGNPGTGGEKRHAHAKHEEKGGVGSGHHAREGKKEKEKAVKKEEKEEGKEEGKANPHPPRAASQGAVLPGEEPEVPSGILEKGIIYFFTRGRVNLDKIGSVDDIQRSHIMLRPIPHDAKLGKGPIGDAGNTRLLALPKKVLPRSGRDRFMAFVDRAGASFDEIKGRFLAGEEYATKTTGTRHTPAATPVGEGVYAVTTTGRESHLVYMLTLPEKLGEVQEALGLKRQDAFIISTKNPTYAGPAYATLPKGADYSKDIMESFRALRWIATRPEHLDYVNSQILMIGESHGIEHAIKGEGIKRKGREEGGGDEAGKEEPIEALENLEEEDLARMRDLGESASIFADLTARAEDYPKLQTTF